MFAFLAHDEDEAEVEVGVGEVGFDDSTDFVVEFGETKVAFVEVEISKVVVRFEMSRVVGQ